MRDSACEPWPRKSNVARCSGSERCNVHYYVGVSGHCDLSWIAERSQTLVSHHLRALVAAVLRPVAHLGAERAGV